MSGHEHQVEVASPMACTDVQIPMREVEGKVAFITGGSRGIGLGIARAFAAAKMRVAIGYRTDEHLVEAMQFLENAGDRVHAIRVDVTDRPGMERAAAQVVRLFGKVHVLVNNAGIVGFAPLSSTTYDDWDWTMNVNVNGVFNGVRTFLPHIRAHGEGGQVITMGSLVGLVAGGRTGSYTASKFAVVGMMESLRAELTGTNIGVSVCCPGVVRTRFVDLHRNRPHHLHDSGFNRDSETMAAVEKSLSAETSMDPLEVGELVLRGMRNNDLYILTHPDTEQVIRDRNEALIASFPPRDSHSSDAGPAKTRTEQRRSIYSTERDRKLRSRRHLPE